MNRALDEIADIVNGKRLGKGNDFQVQTVTIDSRKAAPGYLFFALPGNRCDGHDFVASVLEQGGAAIVNQAVPQVDSSCVIKVNDVQTALQDFARYHRMTSEAKIIAVTGSVGKTTTKDMLAAILSTQLRCLKSEGNYNNELGLPLTLLELQEDHQVAVVEMGMRGTGQIAQLARIAQPDVALITNVAPVHLELLGSINQIAMAKCELLDYLDPRGWALINGDLPDLKAEALRHDAVIYSFGYQEDNEVKLLAVRETKEGLILNCRVFDEEAELYIPLLSESLALDALAAAAVGRQMGISWTNIAQALRSFAPVGHRLRTVELNGNITLIDDCYNANPLSMVAGLQVLSRHRRGRPAVAVLGDMMELGSLESEAHLQVGREAARLADRLITVGKRARLYADGARENGLAPDRINCFANNQEVISFIKENLLDDIVILIKGSRSMEMEQIVTALTGRDV